MKMCDHLSIGQDTLCRRAASVRRADTHAALQHQAFFRLRCFRRSSSSGFDFFACCFSFALFCCCCFHMLSQTCWGGELRMTFFLPPCTFVCVCVTFPSPSFPLARFINVRRSPDDAAGKMIEQKHDNLKSTTFLCGYGVFVLDVRVISRLCIPCRHFRLLFFCSCVDFRSGT